ncbi:hypothetical protein LIER_13047 [Lithospermum erythrorhizon]|uniref:Retrotransposon gag domain-containing protein n=1 Tax=Lithospermum erythrorhizon TaxID=34254 RepID=A0AAV3PY70_LITER
MVRPKYPFPYWLEKTTNNRDRTIETRCTDTTTETSTSSPNKPTTDHEAIKKWRIKASKAMYALTVATEDDLLQRIKDAQTPKDACDTFAAIFARKNDAKLKRLENELLSISQRNMTVSQYFSKVKSLSEDI